MQKILENISPRVFQEFLASVLWFMKISNVLMRQNEPFNSLAAVPVPAATAVAQFVPRRVTYCKTQADAKQF